MVMGLVPGQSLGPFRLGMPISAAIGELRTTYPAYTVNFHYSSIAPLESDMILDVPDMGFRLRFEPVTQRLRLIDVYDSKRVVMSYHGAAWSGPTVEATFIRVYELFGPTFPGKLDTTRGNYFLHYRGLSFSFTIPPEYHALYQSSNDMPLELPNRTTPIVSRVFIYRGSDLFCPDMPRTRGHYCERVSITNNGDGAVSVQFTGRGSELKFGSTLQTVLSELGPPSRVFNKPRPKMHIHSIRGRGGAHGRRSGSQRRSSGGESGSGGGSGGSPLVAQGGLQEAPRHDYFLNYFHLGVDVLMSGKTHTVSKIVLHSNFPGHPEFNQYIKCNFELNWPTQGNPTHAEVDTGAGAGASSGAGAGAGSSSHNSGVEERKSGGVAQFDVNTKWQDIEARMGGNGGRPMVHGSLTNPFGPTYLYAYDGMVIEVMKESGHVATITLFDSRQEGVSTSSAVQQRGRHAVATLE